MKLILQLTAQLGQPFVLGVKLATIGIETEPFLLNMPKGERNRFTLHLPPEDKLKGVRKVVIKNGSY